MIIHHIKARPRLMIATIIGIVLWFFLPDHLRQATRFLIAWDTATIIYLFSVAWMMMHSDHEKIKFRAAAQDEGRVVFLALTTLTAIASLAAIVAELSTAKEAVGYTKGAHIALAGLTVFLSWTFLQTMYALHYAHEFYTERKGQPAQGLEFPGNLHKPDYWDFIYYSFVIGTAAATADINIISGTMRKISTVHCMVAFFFNTTILALTINIGAGLL